jgi:hypothetical protein
MPVVYLTRPIVLDDEKIEKIELDFDKLTGADVLEIETQLRNQQRRFNIYEQSTLLYITAKAAGMIPDDLNQLSLLDFVEVTGHAQLFLFRAELNQQETSAEQQ